MNSLIIISITAVSLASLSCKKFLKEEPIGFIKTDDFYKTESDAVSAINAAYFLLNAGGNAVQTPYNTLFNTGLNFMADDEYPGPGATNPDVRSMANLSHTSSNLRVYELWQQHYAAIRKANLVLEKVPAIPMDDNLKNRILGEAKFLRALWYFNLVRLYGDVPVVLQPQYGVKASEYAITRKPSVEVYFQIEKDLKEAAADLPSSYASPNVGRATKGAALSLLSKVYLTKASHPLNLTVHYADAIEYAEQAISTTDGGTGTFGYKLMPNYANVFLPAAETGNTEQIFAAQFNRGNSSTFNTQGNNQNPRSIRTLILGLNGSYADQVWFYSVPDATKPNGVDNYFSIFKLYTPQDKRRDVTFVTNYKVAGTFYGGLNDPNIKGSKLDSIPYFNKTWDPASTATTSESGANVSIIRYGEVLLNHAEAENELNGPTDKAYRSIDLVRERAGLAKLTKPLTKEQFRDSVYLDRRLELVFEYHRWFDLVRQKDATGNNIFVKSLRAAGKLNAQDKHRLHPIPLNELQLNPLLTQNPGY